MEQIAPENPDDSRYPPMKMPRPRFKPNPLRDWLEQYPPLMSKRQFARLCGITEGYVSRLIADDPPWPQRRILFRIAMVTKGRVTPNDLAGYPPQV